MKKILFFLLFIIHGFAGSVGEDNNAFTFSLYSQLKDSPDNLALSPYGIFTNLSLLYFGSKEQTAAQFKEVLHFAVKGSTFLKTFEKHFKGLTDPVDGGYQLNIANGLFPHKGTHFLNKFKQIATNTYEAKLQSVDYDIVDSTLETINGWISEKTDGNITDLVREEDIDPSTRLIVANAVYFQGDWTYPFYHRMTTQAPFTLENGKEIDVHMLQQTQYFPYFENEYMQLLALPFIRKQTDQPFLECVLVLPKKSLKKVNKRLTAESFDQWLKKSRSTLIEASIPKFSFSKRLNLKNSLKAMGLEDAFTYQANFSKIDGMKDLFLNKILHETYFSFHETGVTAASATTSHIGVTSVPPREEPAIAFNANHPFLFFIVDYHSRAILFMGKVMNPEEGTSDDH